MGDETVAGKGTAGDSKPWLVGLSVALVCALAAVVVLAVLLADSRDSRYENAKRLLVAVSENPAEMIHWLRESDSSGKLLIDSLSAVRSRDQAEFERFADEISSRLIGEDQVAFFTSRNSYGEENARILGYFDGCLFEAGLQETPYPQDKAGEPYEGASEVPYKTEFNAVVGEK